MNNLPIHKVTGIEVAKAVRIWLFIGLVMIFFQVVIGGITRLTGSGLSITKWEIVTGTIPPLNATQWQSEFEAYKAKPQYQKINYGMSLSEFKFIYFWEYFHRLWARLMGFVFAIPFFYFLWKRQLPKPLLRRLLVVILLAAIVASFGWIMVASGLIDRPWVDAYKLTLHLSLAFILFAYLLWTALHCWYPHKEVVQHGGLRRLALSVTIVAAVQILLGGLMSGMKAGLLYPTFPDMQGVLIPHLLFQSENWQLANFTHYDKNPFAPSLVQVLHRSTAYLLTILVLVFFFKMRQFRLPLPLRVGSYTLLVVLAVQFTLGVLTVINCIGTIPVGLGVLHQGGALVLWAVALFTNYHLSVSSVMLHPIKNVVKP